MSRKSNLAKQSATAVGIALCAMAGFTHTPAHADTVPGSDIAVKVKCQGTMTRNDVSPCHVLVSNYGREPAIVPAVVIAVAGRHAGIVYGCSIDDTADGMGASTPQAEGCYVGPLAGGETKELAVHVQVEKEAVVGDPVVVAAAAYPMAEDFVPANNVDVTVSTVS